MAWITKSSPDCRPRARISEILEKRLANAADVVYIGSHMGVSASILVYVPRALREGCDGAGQVAVEADTVRGVLDALARHFPKVYVGICDETGRVRRHINVFVNTSHMLERDGLDTLLQTGDTVTLLPAVSGG